MQTNGRYAISAMPDKYWTVEEYLEFERTSDIKHEYLEGQFYAMAGAKQAHNLICAAANHYLFPPARKRGCRLYASDMRVRTPSGLYAYPDLGVVCGLPQIVEERGQESLLNPTLIIEVLSASTEQFDRAKKFTHYKSLSSLQDYVLVAQYQPVVECFTRQDNGQWVHTLAVGLDGSIHIPSLDAALNLADIYEQVVFGASTPASDENNSADTP